LAGPAQQEGARPARSDDQRTDTVRDDGTSEPPRLELPDPLGSVFSPPNVTSSIEVELVAQAATVRFARRLACEWFRHWQAPTHAIEAAELVTSELVTNASAPRGALSYPRWSREELEGGFWV
jgi:hypothetical protein